MEKSNFLLERPEIPHGASVIAARSKPTHSKQKALTALRGEHFPAQEATKRLLADSGVVFSLAARLREIFDSKEQSEGRNMVTPKKTNRHTGAQASE